MPVVEDRQYQEDLIQEARLKIAEGMRRLIIQAETGSGKAQPLSSKVLTPSGFARMSEVSVGDRLIGSDGKPCTVTGVFPQGVMPVFRVLFSDGSSARCTSDHLWAVQTRLDKFKGKPFSVMSASEIADQMRRFSWKRYYLPLVKPIQFDSSCSLPIDPYLLGVLIGDGSIVRSVLFSSADVEIVDSVRQLIPKGLRVAHRGGFDYAITGGRSGGRPNEIKDALRSLGLFGSMSTDKFIPEKYLRASVADRIALLQGLMDADGTISSNGQAAEFGTSSRMLADGVCELVRSLGGCTRIRVRAPSKYTYLGEIRVSKFQSYRIRVSLCGINPFRLKRKAKLYNQNPQQGRTKGIVSIEPDGTEECQCISVSSSDNLYVTDDYVLTHNTVIACKIMKSAVERGRRCLFLAPQRQLVVQCSDKLWDFGTNHGIIMRGEELTIGPVQVASKDTLQSWALKRGKIKMPPADIVFVDECHMSLSQGWRKIIQHYIDAGAIVIGLSATPGRTDGRGLGGIYDAMIAGPSNSKLIELGFKVPSRCFAPSMPDLRQVPTNANGDYQEDPLGKVMQEQVLVGDVIENWVKFAQNRKTIVFCSGVAHSLYIRDRFREAGYRFEHIDGATEPEERKRIFDAIRNGDITGITNCNVATTGVDLPCVSCLVLLRPTKSFILYRQIVGRGGRPCLEEGKRDCLILDHSGMIYTHGLPDDDVEWSLDPEEKIQDKVKKDRKDKPDKEPIICPKCFAAFSKSRQCPNCGNVLERGARKVETVKGDLMEIDRAGKVKPKKEEKERFWHRCLAVCAARGRKAGAAAHMYKKEYGIWPRALTPMPKDAEWQMSVAVLYPGFLRRRADALAAPIPGSGFEPGERPGQGEVPHSQVSSPRGPQEQPLFVD